MVNAYRPKRGQQQEVESGSNQSQLSPKVGGPRLKAKYSSLLHVFSDIYFLCLMALASQLETHVKAWVGYSNQSVLGKTAASHFPLLCLDGHNQTGIDLEVL